MVVVVAEVVVGSRNQSTNTQKYREEVSVQADRSKEKMIKTDEVQGVKVQAHRSKGSVLSDLLTGSHGCMSTSVATLAL